jgi:hypothetical protein
LQQDLTLQVMASTSPMSSISCTFLRYTAAKVVLNSEKLQKKLCFSLENKKKEKIPLFFARLFVNLQG